MSAGWLGCRSFFRMAEFSPILRRYLAAVSVTGLATLVALVGIAPGGLVANPTPALALLALLVVLGEVFPIKLPGDDGEFTTSTTFAFALLITGGCEKAMVALAAGSLITDLLRRRSPWRGAFNIAQYTLALAAAGTIVQLLTALPNDSGGFRPPRPPPVPAPARGARPDRPVPPRAADRQRRFRAARPPGDPPRRTGLLLRQQPAGGGGARAGRRPADPPHAGPGLRRPGLDRGDAAGP